MLPQEAMAEIEKELDKCYNKINKEFFVIGVGGIESWVTALSAMDKFGPNKVLGVNIYSIFSNSKLPLYAQSIAQDHNFQICTVDISKIIQEQLSAKIGLFRVEKEELHYSMNEYQKGSIIGMIRDITLRGIADRHDAILLSGISSSKIQYGWAPHQFSFFDWNPLINLSYGDVRDIAKERKINDELIKFKSGMDVMPTGGFFPQDMDINFYEKTNKKPKINIGVGLYQERN